jgi:catechol-2,3-dioxygenase
VRFVATCVLTVSLCFQGANASPAQGSGAVTGKVKAAFFALSAVDVAALSRWYQEKLGFRVLLQSEFPDKKGKLAILEGDGTIIELVQTSEAKPRSVAEPYHLHGIFKVGMVVADLDGVYRELKKRNVPLVHDMMKATKEVPLRSFIVHDGEANLVQFFGK